MQRVTKSWVSLVADLPPLTETRESPCTAKTHLKYISGNETTLLKTQWVKEEITIDTRK